MEEYMPLGISEEEPSYGHRGLRARQAIPVGGARLEASRLSPRGCGGATTTCTACAPSSSVERIIEGFVAVPLKPTRDS
jgi:hypothetical protein